VKDLIERQVAIGWLESNLTYMQTFGADRSMALLNDLPPVQLTPCDVCRYNPPSSTDGKPCSVCPAEGRIDE
jgi:hypothetical protein